MYQLIEENKTVVLVIGGLFIAGMLVLIAWMDDDDNIKY